MTEVHKSQSVAIRTSDKVLNSVGVYLDADSLINFFTQYNYGDKAEICVSHRLPNNDKYMLSVRLDATPDSWKPTFVMGWYNGARDCDWAFEPNGNITVRETYSNDIKLPKRILQFAEA